MQGGTSREARQLLFDLTKRGASNDVQSEKDEVSAVIKTGRS